MNLKPFSPEFSQNYSILKNIGATGPSPGVVRKKIPYIAKKPRFVVRKLTKEEREAEEAAKAAEAAVPAKKRKASKKKAVRYIRVSE